MDAQISINLNWGMMFLIQTTAGILANSFLFRLYTFPLFTEQVVRPTSLILSQLVICNNLVLFSKGIPQTVATFGLTFFLEESGCKVIFYIHRVARGVSLSTTSLLSGFQAIKLHPNTCGWLNLRIRSPKCIGTCCFLCWIPQLVLNIPVSMTKTVPQNSKNLSAKGFYRYCSSTMPEKLTFLLKAVILSLSDITCLVIMAWASGSMILVLRKHKHRVQHIHSHSLSPRPSHEDRATRTILILVTMFLSFYSVASMLSLWLTQTVNPSHWLLNTSVLLSLGFPALSPIVFSVNNICVPHFCSVFWTKKADGLTMVSEVVVASRT
ncbi:vomeronasal type-1 receptor 1 [Phodopus roborovskii]|uniref:Vomeronasal type-1 receptor n=1 Tax=Phodopus roborovskii TaxID=109678 RepID=A0AAV0A9M9_PHORO|nr:vomeronasal type-1 receptor 1 [Phodopus roborovskii]CAH7400532.1 Vom1r53 [Phodopus roborovskii]